MIRSELRGGLAIATLDRESALNSLDLEMVRTLKGLLEAWQADPRVGAILLQGAGRAFCAGGDVKSVAASLRAGDSRYGLDFFTTEYRLDHAIHVSKKPLVVLAHGYVMGGGLGLAAGAAIRVVTDSTRMAMPELVIGLFPDVGGSWFLNRMPGRLGLFMALTSARLNAGDALATGLADVFVPDAQAEELRELLVTACRSPGVTRASVADALTPLASRFAAPAGLLCRHQDVIDQTLGGDDARAALARLATLTTQDDEFLREAARTFTAGSPTSALVIWEQLKRGRGLSLADCLRMELGITIQCGRHHDFREGVRALLIDKDRKPRWRPAALQEVTRELILEHFESPWAAQNHPLRDL